MGLADFIHDLIPKRWKDRIDGFDPIIKNYQNQNPVTPQPEPQQFLRSPQVNPSLPSASVPDQSIVEPSREFVPTGDFNQSKLSQVGEPPEMAFNPISANRTSYEPWHSTDRRKPVISPTAKGDSLTIAQDERNALEQWRPERKRGVMNTLEGAGRGFVAGGLPGAVVGGVGSLISPNLTGQMERRTLLDRANDTVARQFGERQAQGELDAQDIKPQLINAAAEKERQKQERESLAESLELHKGIPFDPNDPNDVALVAQAKKLGVRVPTRYAEIKPNAQPHNPLLRERKNEDGSTTTFQSNDYGKTWAEAENLGSAAPPVKPDNLPDNATRASWFYKQQHEQESGAAELRRQAGLIKAQAGYELPADQKAVKQDLLQRAREADKNALDFREKGDKASTEAKPRVNSRLAVVKPAKDGKYHYTPEQIRQSLQSGQTYEDIYTKLKANPKVIIDEQ